MKLLMQTFKQKLQKYTALTPVDLPNTLTLSSI